jgi:hypothetical protein
MDNQTVRPVGRPAIEITDEHIEIIELRAGQGMTLSQIALFCDVSDSTLDRWMSEPKIKRAYERGRLIAHGQVAGTLFNLAIEGDTTAAIFYLKAQAGWVDKPQQTTENTGNSVVFYIPENGRAA